MLEIKCGSDLIRTDFWSKNMGQTHFIQKVITSQDLSDNTTSLTVPNYMGHQVYHMLTIVEEPMDFLGGEVYVRHCFGLC